MSGHILVSGHAHILNSALFLCHFFCPWSHTLPHTQSYALLQLFNPDNVAFCTLVAREDFLTTAAGPPEKVIGTLEAASWMGPLSRLSTSYFGAEHIMHNNQ